MRKVKLNFEDCWFADYRKSVPMSYLIGEISKIYDVEISTEPEFLICSCFGNKAILSDCCKIYFAGENIIPDFNIYDYGIGFSDICFGDRYLRFPLYALYRSDFDMAINKRNNDRNIESKKFCNMVVSNKSIANDIRIKIFERLSQYKRVDSGGGIFNNVGGAVKDKFVFQRDYKFSLAFENSSHPGYITEKIIQAWAAGTIPIYWGAPDVTNEFNAKAFINGTGKSIEEIVEEVISVDNSEECYFEMLNCNIYGDGLQVMKYMSTEKLLDFFDHIFGQKNPYRVSKEGSSTIYTNRLYRQARLEYSKVGQAVKSVVKIFR